MLIMLGIFRSGEDDGNKTQKTIVLISKSNIIKVHVHQLFSYKNHAYY